MVMLMKSDACGTWNVIRVVKDAEPSLAVTWHSVSLNVHVREEVSCKRADHLCSSCKSMCQTCRA